MVCCIAGSKVFSEDCLPDMLFELNSKIASLIAQGVTHFLCGGAPGFELIAASLIIAKKKTGAAISLILALPASSAYPSRNDHQLLLSRLTKEADGVIYLSCEQETDHARQYYHDLVNMSSVLLFAPSPGTQGLSQTLSYARQSGLKIIILSAYTNAAQSAL